MEKLTEKTLVEKGIQLYKDGEFKKSKKVFSELIEINPKSVDGFFYLANIFHIQGEVGKAIKAFSKVLEIDPSHTDASISLSVLYNDIGKYEQGKKIFEMANERIKVNKANSTIEDNHINKKFSFKHYELADLYMTYNRYDEALFEFNKAFNLDPENLDARIKMAKVYAKKGFIGKAFDELKRLKNEQPHYIPAKIALGVLYYGNGRVVEAQNEWEKVLSQDPNNKEAGMYLNLSQTATETTL
ncbi:MAG: tetratricopeptide repeat protein [Halobacteriovoraceae bacterium]|nr:tetratricopeptide repeat protein [Halobacteriovoraceae bacterium]